MTNNSNMKRRVRARSAKTGESYTTALKHFLPTTTHQPTPELRTVRLAVAQTIQRRDPSNVTELRECGLEMRRLMVHAKDAGARVVHFPEGATCFPHKRIISIDGPEKVGPSDWARVEWEVLKAELAATAELAQKLKLWTAFGSIHQLGSPHRPHNSLYILSDSGKLASRYDERMLSRTKISFMYSPGSAPVMFEVDGVRFGCALGMECHFPEIFSEYERMGVDCVLFSTTGGEPSDGPIFATESQGHAAANTYWLSFSVHAQHSSITPAGVITPRGAWTAQCPQDGRASLVVVDIDNSPGNGARLWRRTARSGIYDSHLVHDERSEDRLKF